MVTTRSGDNYVPDFAGALRFFRGQIPCRLYKSPLDETVNGGPLSTYTCKKTSSVHVKDPVVQVRIGWIKETPDNPACLAEVFRLSVLDIVQKETKRKLTHHQ